MIGFIILVASLVIAAAGIVQSNKAIQTIPAKRTVFGMTKLGFWLLVVACIGFAASAAEQLIKWRETAHLRRQAEEDTNLLKAMNAKIDYLLGETEEPIIARELEKLRDQMNFAASRSRATNFSLSDFSFSQFDNGNFTRTYFPGALFKEAGFNDASFQGASFEGASFAGAHMKGADFRSVNLSEILIDSKTILPRQLAAASDRLRVLIQYYPSTAASAIALRRMLAASGFQIVHFRPLREGQLSPRMGEIIYYSEQTKLAAEELQPIISQRLGAKLRVVRSPYFGDPASESKLFINMF